MRKVNLRAAVLAAVILAALGIAAALLWSHPKILIYVLVGGIALLAYGALYLIVSARMEPKDQTGVGPSPTTPRSLHDVSRPDNVTDISAGRPADGAEADRKSDSG